MIEYFRVAVIAGAAWVYMGLMAAKFFQIQSCTSCCLDYLEGTEERITLLRLQNARRYSARNDLVRLLADFLILIGVAATGAFPAWFSLFPDSIPGFALGFAVLIFFSLTLSIVVDWVMASRYMSAAKDRKQICRQYIHKQFMSIVCIGFGIDIAISAFCFPVRWGVSTSVAIAISAATLILYRFLLLGVRELLEHRKDRQEDAFSNEENVFSDEEERAAELHDEALRRKKHRIRKYALTALQYVCIVLFLIQVVWIIEEGAPREIRTVRDLLEGKGSIVITITACVLWLEIVQIYGNIAAWQRLSGADLAVVRAGYGKGLRSLLIRTASLQQLSSDPFAEILGRNPLLLRVRVPEIDQEIKHTEEEHGREKHSD